MMPPSRVPLALALLMACAAPALAGEVRRGDEAILPAVPGGGRIVQQGDRLDLYDAKSNRTGYGYVRPDGSADLFNLDGTRRATIAPGPGGRVRVTVPRKRERGGEHGR